MANYAQHLAPRTTPQNQPIFGHEHRQVENSAGGYTYQLDKWGRLNRFLILGSEKGTYYASERKLTIENAHCINECAKEDPDRTIATIVQISEEGRAPKNDPAIFALALLASNEDARVRELALASVSRVCRTGTHLFQFAEAVQSFRGWGRGLRKAIARWYTDKPADKLAYQVTKYQQRNGWSHRDLLRLSHPSTPDVRTTEVIKYAAGKEINFDLTPSLISAVEQAKTATTPEQIVKLIDDFGLVREHIPTQFLNSVDVWNSMLVNMPVIAMTRNLGKMSSIGLLKPLASQVNTVTEALTNDEKLRKSKIHPFQILLALKTYSQGHGDKGSLSWTPVPQIVDALNEAFYKSFGFIELSNKRTFIGLDVSGSMCESTIAGSCLSAREASAAMCMATVRTEPSYFVAGFTHKLTPLPKITAKSRLDDVVNYVSGLDFDRTDCAQPMLYALSNKLDVDTFIVYTDNETWCGNIHPSQALIQYREKTGIDAKLIVVGMTATDFTIADPLDAGMLDVVGFDSSAPSVISDFSRN